MEWKPYLMGIAEAASVKSKDGTKVGAILVGPNGEVLLTAFNGIPMGVTDKPERRDTRPEKYLWVSHAESNILAFAARRGIATEGMTVFVTHYCCSGCATSLIQAGIKRVVVGRGTTSMPEDEFRVAETMFREAGVAVERLE